MHAVIAVLLLQLQNYPKRYYFKFLKLKTINLLFKKAFEEELKRLPDVLVKNEDFLKNSDTKSNALEYFSVGNEIAANTLDFNSDEITEQSQKARKKSDFEIQNNLRNFTVRHCSVCQRADKIYLMQV